uniref:Apolipoprotein D n=1 Tax=Haematobia irritans TaxID=7368 RepID=A0A1L8EAT4_HAEIR
MFVKATFLLVLAAIVSVINGQLSQVGRCPVNVKSVEYLDIEKYMGTWHEYCKYPVYFEANGKCVSAQYSLNSDGSVRVLNSLINIKNNVSEVIDGSANLISPGKLYVKFPVSGGYSISSNYWVLDTDYENYAVVYSCNPLGAYAHSTIAWILTRERIPDPKYIQKAVGVLRENGISMREMKITNQMAC